MKKTLQIGNGLALGTTIFLNYLSNTGMMNNTTIGEVSGGLQTLFTPAGYAFSIWGLIYLLLLAFAIFQGRSLLTKVKNDSFILKIGWWFVLSCVANCAWIFAWIYEYTGLSCIFIFALLVSLLKIVLNLNMKLEKVSRSIKLLVWLPFAIYSGWVTVASIANVSAYLFKLDWIGFGFQPATWTILMIAIATIINLVVIWKRNMFEFGFVGAWALFAIAIANAGFEDAVSTVAYVGAGFLCLSSFANLVRPEQFDYLKQRLRQ